MLFPMRGSASFPVYSHALLSSAAYAQVTYSKSGIASDGFHNTVLVKWN